MTEDFLHFIWRTHNFNFQHLSTTEGSPVEIVDFGQWNTNAGPDFNMAKIRLGETLWAGSVEIHLSASEWIRHAHTADPAYQNVILHVVLEEDVPVYSGTRRLPCIELKDKIDRHLLGSYSRLMANAAWVPCAPQLKDVPLLTRKLWLERILVERLEVKTGRIFALLEETKNNWEEALYRTLATAYGFKINAAPFERLARLLPLAHIYKHQDSPLQLEALYFGSAGLLNQIFTDAYPQRLQQEFHHLATKYDLGAIAAHAWKRGRLRPANFPTLRIAQFAAMMTSFQGLFSLLLETTDIHALRASFTKPVSHYWTCHYDFDKSLVAAPKQMGNNSADGILINTVVPFLFCYGKIHQDEQLTEHAVRLMTQLSYEENKITRHWTALDMPHEHAGHSQGLIHLKTAYCDCKRCVECAIGNHILSSSSD